MQNHAKLSASKRFFTSIPKDLIEAAVAADVTMVDFSKNEISEIPNHFEMIMPKLTELHMGYNKLTSVPSFIGLAHHMQFLNIRNNQLQTLPSEIANLVCLRELNLCNNRFISLPNAVFELKKLEIILAADNQIEDIDISGLSQLPVLAVVDLENNSIQVVPPEVGNLKQIRSMYLEGNLIRNVPKGIPYKGTGALFEFLKSRIPQS